MSETGAAVAAAAVPTPSAAVRPLEIRLFGGMEVFVRGELLPSLRSRRGYYLLALLTLRSLGRQETPRSHFAGLLWPDSEEELALASLRRALTDLRQALGPEAERLHAPTPRTLALDLSGGAFADVHAFDQAAVRTDILAREEAVALYRGELLADCPEDWALQERAPREEAFLDALEALADDALATDRAHEALRYLRRAVAVNPWRETAQRGLLRALAAVGDHAGLTLAYREFRLSLHREMNTQPDRETRDLYSRLRGGDPVATVPVAAAAPVAARSSAPWTRPLTTLIGREQETKEVLAAIAAAPLVTLNGPGGVGKTRLALQVAERARSSFPDGVGFVELGPLADPALVPGAVAVALGLREGGAQPSAELLPAYLSSKRFLLVLDNCEHLQEACATLAAELLAVCPGMCLLTTSRHALGLAGEVVWRVPSLALPEEGVENTVDELLQYEAVGLFVARALAAHSRFALSPANAATVVHICRRLDAIPLAIELAAPLVRVLTVEQIASRLEDRFRLLSRGRGNGAGRPIHQQTLQAAMDWSYNLLSEPEQLMLRRLSVFAGGCTLEAAHAVCGDPGDDEWATIDLLTLLADKSLVQSDDRDGREARYLLLETVREYGKARLGEKGEQDEVGERHLDYFHDYALRVEPHLIGPEQGHYMDRVEVEHDNLRAALNRADGNRRLRIMGALQRFWQRRGYLTEGRAYLDAALDYQEVQQEPALRAKGLNAAGIMAVSQDDHGAARRRLTEAAALYEELGDRRGLAGALNNLGMVAQATGEADRARDLYLQALALNRDLGNRLWEGMNLNNLGSLADKLGDLDAAREYAEQSLAISRELGNQAGAAGTLNNLGMIACRRGEYARAATLLKQALAINREVGNRGWEAINLFNLGRCLLESGDTEAVGEPARECLRLWHEIGRKPMIAGALDLLGALAFLQGKHEGAARTWGAALALMNGDPMALASELSQEVFYTRFASRAREVLGEAAFASALEQGSQLPLGQAVAEALR